VEPFILSCSACQSRIRIRNPKLIGQRVNCPKCNAEVLVALPAPPKIHVASDQGAEVDSYALTKDGLSSTFQASPEDNDSYPLRETSEGEPALSSLDFSEVDDVLIQHAHGSNGSAETAANWQAPQRTPERAAPSQQWSSKSTARSRQFLIVGFLGLSSFILAGLLFAFFLKWYSKEDLQAAKPLDNKPDAIEKQVDNTLPDPDPKENEPEAIDQTPIVQPTQIDLGPTQQPEPAKPVENIGALSPTQPTPDTPSPEPMKPPADVPPQIAELLKVLGEPPIIEMPRSVPVPDIAAVTESEINTGLGYATMAPVAQLSETANNRQVHGISIEKKSLAPALSFWNSIVGLPTVADPLALSAADFDRNALFDIKIPSSPAVTAIDHFASSLGLKAQAVENRFWLLSLPAADESKLPWNIKVDDIVKTKEEETWLLETFELIYPGTSASLSIGNGNLIGKPDLIDRLTWFAIVRVLENWRMQAGLPVQLSGYRSENLKTPFVTMDKIPALKQELDEVTSSPKNLAWLLNHHSNAVGLTCWVDWPSLEYLPDRLASPQRSIGPATLRVSVTRKRPLMELLNELDFELGITCLLINEKNIWLTSHYQYRRVPDVFVLPSEDKSVDGFWSQYLRPLTPIDAAGISQVILRPTPDGKFIIAKCCWPTLQFAP
jgi:hypothetical protein